MIKDIPSVRERFHGVNIAPVADGSTGATRRLLPALALIALPAAALLLAGCSQPIFGSVGTAGAETRRGLFGYTETEYVYPVQVPGTNRFVEIRTDKPFDTDPTYEDYLRWEEAKSGSNKPAQQRKFR